MKRFIRLAAAFAFFFTFQTMAAECELSLRSDADDLLQEAKQRMHEGDGRWCGRWDDEFKTNLVVVLKDKAHYYYNVHLPTPSQPRSGKVKYKMNDDGEITFNFSTGGGARVYAIIKNDELHAVYKRGSSTRATAILTREGAGPDTSKQVSE